MHAAALVGIDGSIDWFCAPRFDSPSIFGALLDGEKGGRFSIRPTGDDATCKQSYWPQSNVLVTRFLAPHGGGELVDFMPVGRARGDATRIIRRVRGMRGSVEMRMRCRPAFDYARAGHEITKIDGGYRFTSDRQSFSIVGDVELREEDGGLAATFSLDEGDQCAFILRDESDNAPMKPPNLDREAVDHAFDATVEYWRSWVGSCAYQGRWREMVHRSALALKLLTYEPTGAIVAAPTCGLPERLGGTRNWDYRYAWVRDGAFTLYALLRLGFRDEAARYMSFLLNACKKCSEEGPLQVMYGVGGETELPEHELDHLHGYGGSRPIRTGNAAHTQLQLDIYGALMDAAYLYNKWGEPISSDTWRSLTGFVDWVCDNWRTEDEGIWETRGGRRHFTYSKVMCWVAIDRALRLARKRSFPADTRRWMACRDEIFHEVMQRGWSEEREAFVQAYDVDQLDAANLIMPLVFFMAPTDPKMIATIDAINRSPRDGGLVTNGLVFRYDPEASPDGVGGHEGTFNMCTFWLVEALTRAGRFQPERLREAVLIFERMLGFSNHLGLYAEEIGFSGEALGNFPQAFTHLSLISAAFNLDRAMDAG